MSSDPHQPVKRLAETMHERRFAYGFSLSEMDQLRSRCTIQRKQSNTRNRRPPNWQDHVEKRRRDVRRKKRKRRGKG